MNFMLRLLGKLSARCRNEPGADARKRQMAEAQRFHKLPLSCGERRQTGM
jgi:hypothetical protein